MISVWFLLLFVAERRFPAIATHFTGQNTARLGRNGSFWLVNSLLSLSIILPLTQLASENAIWQRQANGGISMLLLDILLLEIWIYWWHRANHRLPFLWRFHQVHHLDAHLDSTSAIRFHSGEVVLSALARAGLIILLAIPFHHVLLFEMLILLHTVFHHSNIRVPQKLETALDWVVITPSVHRMHHHNIRADTDSNYGTIFSVWDRLFRSRNTGKFTPDMQIGVENAKEKSLGKLWKLPFISQD